MKFLLVALTLLHGTALACDPVAPPAAQLKASEALRNLKSRFVACPVAPPPRHTARCELYPLAPARLLPLLKAAYRAKATPLGSGWRLSGWSQEPFEHRELTLLVRAAPGGTLVNERQVITAEDKLREVLQEALHTWKKSSHKPSCAGLGVQSNEWYTVFQCKILPTRTNDHLKDEPYVLISLKSAVDQTVRVPWPMRFGYTGNTCSPSGFF